MKEVDFAKYCLKCEYKELKENEHPCFECLETPARIDSKKPVNFKELDDEE